MSHGHLPGRGYDYGSYNFGHGVPQDLGDYCASWGRRAGGYVIDGVMGCERVGEGADEGDAAGCADAVGEGGCLGGGGRRPVDLSAPETGAGLVGEEDAAGLVARALEDVEALADEVERVGAFAEVEQALSGVDGQVGLTHPRARESGIARTNTAVEMSPRPRWCCAAGPVRARPCSAGTRRWHPRAPVPRCGPDGEGVADLPCGCCTGRDGERVRSRRLLRDVPALGPEPLRRPAEVGRRVRRELRGVRRERTLRGDVREVQGSDPVRVFGREELRDGVSNVAAGHRVPRVTEFIQSIRNDPGDAIGRHAGQG
ncbi:hypothetical protein ACIBSV_35960 [Embleya sp. NPDC050154]|uniref:hypothetical protein n=1 Tax=Embleya sp. NPDC050154 TaxID=3363988 RepID=UPI0037A4D9AC